ncbi:hypothetical protein ABK040_007874 [Willaertia magna]
MNFLQLIRKKNRLEINNIEDHYELKQQHTPIDKEQFYERVRTFTITNWFDKPFSINPLICSRYGYINYSIDKIKCCECQVKLCFKTIFKEIQILDKNLINKKANEFIEEMLNNHKQNCVFYKHPSPLRFTLFGNVDSSSGKNKNIIKLHCFIFHRLFKKLLKSLKEYKINLDLNNFYNKYHFENEKIIYDILENKLSLKKELITNQIIIYFWLSLFHWELLSQLNNNNEKEYYLHCEYCQMNYYLKKELNNILNPFEMHKWWCPCIHSNNLDENIFLITIGGNNYTQSKRQLNEKAGWIQLLDSLKEDMSKFIDLEINNQSNVLLDKFNIKKGMVNDILSQSVSPLFLSEKSRKEALRRLFEPTTAIVPVVDNNQLVVVNNVDKTSIVEVSPKITTVVVPSTKTTVVEKPPVEEIQEIELIDLGKEKEIIKEATNKVEQVVVTEQKEVREKDSINNVEEIKQKQEETLGMTTTVDKTTVEITQEKTESIVSPVITTEPMMEEEPTVDIHQEDLTVTSPIREEPKTEEKTATTPKTAASKTTEKSSGKKPPKDSSSRQRTTSPHKKGRASSSSYSGRDDRRYNTQKRKQQKSSSSHGQYKKRK